jgi:hypothetical protein
LKFKLGVNFKVDEDRKKWFENLKEGDIIDIVRGEFSSTCSWSRGQIKSKSEDIIKCVYLNSFVKDEI